MREFTAKYAGQIAGVLHGFEGWVLRGILRQIAYPFGLQGYLWANQVLLKDFGPHVQSQRAGQDRGTAVSRGLRLLRAHRLIRKVPHTHRYHVTELGRHFPPPFQSHARPLSNH